MSKIKTFAAVMVAAILAVSCFVFAACTETGDTSASVTPSASVAPSASTTPSASASTSVRPSTSTTPSASASTSVRPSTSTTPSASASATTSTSGGGTDPQPAQPLPDDHQGTSAEDASWARYDLYALNKTTTSTVVAENAQSYVVAVNGVAGTEGNQGSAMNISGSNRANSEGYLPIGNLNRNTNATITYTINVSAAAKVGIYGQFSDRATSDPLITFSDIFSLTVNGTAQTVTTNLPQGGSNYAASNRYIFLGFVNLSAGRNTVVLTVTMPNANNNGYNFYGFRFSAQSATITGAAATPAA